MKNQVAFSVRFDLDNKGNKKAWEHLQRMDRNKYRSYSHLVSVAINALYEGNKDDDIVAQLRATIREEMANIQVVSVPVIKEEIVKASAQDDGMETALDFADSF